MKRVLGLDVGERRIGLALSDALGLTAGPLAVLERTTLEADLEALRRMVVRHDVGSVVIGLPLTMRGERGPQAQRVVTFGGVVSRRLNVPVTFADERLTTAQGERALLETDTSRRRRKQVIDQVAAQLILQQFLETQRRKAPPHDDPSR